MIAIIPARGGSKGLPGKNIKEFNGKPLIVHTIEAAKKSKKISQIIVSTDDSMIADIAEKHGALVPFIRPSYLAEDTSNAIDVYLHAIDFLMANTKQEIKKFMVLLPTTPLRSEVHINQAIVLFESEAAHSLVSVYEAETPPSWYFKLNSKNRLVSAGFEIGKQLANRQENNTYYIPNGAIYILDYLTLKENRTYYTQDTIPFIMDRKFSIDIDAIDDFYYAEFLSKNLDKL